MDIKKLTQEVLLKNMTPEQQLAVLDSVTASVKEAKAVQKQKIAENVDLVLQALKRIEADMLKRVDGSAKTVEDRVKSIKDGKDGKNGLDGKAGKDGINGKDGKDGRDGRDGLNGKAGERGQDGVGVQNAHIDFDGSLIIALTNGQELNVGEVVPFDVAEKIRVIGNGGGTSQFVIDALADLQAQINLIGGGLVYKGTWNASTNTPILTSGVGVNGWYYVVSVAGTTNLDGITDWQAGDWAIFNGTFWQKIDQTNTVTSVNGQTGVVNVGTVTSVATGVGLTGGTITSTGTVSFSNAAVGTWAATPSSANLAAAVTDETGSGSLVFANGPTLSAVTVDGADPYVQFSNGSAVALAAGRMWYNGTTGSWNLGMGGGNITQQVGEELFLYGKASAAITDSPLQIVYQTGTVGASGVITFAPTISGITNGDLIVGIATENLALNNFGRVTTFGVIHGVTTNGTAYGETWADGDTIWYNPVTGNPTKTKPVAPNIKVSLGTVINAAGGGAGSFQVEINHGSVLGGTDSNVQLTSPTGGQMLSYDQTSGYWKNINLSAGTGISVTPASNGSITVANTGVTSVTGTSPVVSSGGSIPAISLAANYGDTQNPYASKTANFILAAPNGSSGVPTFRAIVTADIPTLNQNTTGSAATVTTTINSGVVATTQASGDNSTKVATTAYVNAITGTNGITGFKNRIINGAMMIDQRNAGASVTIPASTSTYTVDRWAGYASQASKFSVQQSSVAPAGFKNSILITSLAATSVGTTDFYQIGQGIEGYNIADLGWGAAGAATITLSFWVRSSLTGTFGGNLITGSGDQSYPFTYTISSANTWEQKFVTVSGPNAGTFSSTNGIGVSINFSLGAGATVSGASGSWAGSVYRSATGATQLVATNGATLQLTGVQLEKGSTATSFDYRPYGTELALCQRYFWSPVLGVGLSSYVGVVNTTTSGLPVIPHPVTMRAAPTVTYSGTFGMDDGSVGATSTSVTTNMASVNSIRPYFTGISPSLSTGRCMTLTSGGTIAISAEL